MYKIKNSIYQYINQFLYITINIPMKKNKDLIKQESFNKDVSQYFIFKQLDKNSINQIVPNEIWVIQKVFTDKACQKLIQLTEKLGYGVALLNTGSQDYGYIDKSVRDHKRVMIDDLSSAKLLYQFLKNKVPLCQQGLYFWGVNERLRFLKYNKSNNFAEHIDGRFPRNSLEVSVLTLQIYLNKVGKGGSTRFFHEDLKNGFIDVNPDYGNIAIFKQSNWSHSGEPVIQGVKYTIRTDLMYKQLTQEQIQKIKDESCGICKTKIKIQQNPKCKHIYTICECPQVSNWSLRKIKFPVCKFCTS